MKNPITKEVEDALYESASYDWDFDALNNYWRTFLGLEG